MKVRTSNDDFQEIKCSLIGRLIKLKVKERELKRGEIEENRIKEQIERRGELNSSEKGEI